MEAGGRERGLGEGGGGLVIVYGESSVKDFN